MYKINSHNRDFDSRELNKSITTEGMWGFLYERWDFNLDLTRPFVWGSDLKPSVSCSKIIIFIAELVFFFFFFFFFNLFKKNNKKREDWY